jgi:hypothetical protein
LERLWRGGGENDRIMDLKNFRDNENFLGSMVGGQLDDLDFGLNEDMEALNVGGRHLGSQDIQHGLHEWWKGFLIYVLCGLEWSDNIEICAKNIH